MDHFGCGHSCSGRMHRVQPVEQRADHLAFEQHPIGPCLAHRAVQAGENLVHWHTETIRNLSQTLMEYFTEEQPLLAKPVDVHEFFQEVNGLRDNVANLERRVEALINRPR